MVDKMSIVTFKYRVKDKRSAKHLDRMAVGCNRVWNFCNATQLEAQRRWRNGEPGKRPTAFDLINLCTGAAADLGIHADAMAMICQRFALARNASGGRATRFRTSFGARRSLGWIPFKPRDIRIDGNAVIYRRLRYRFWKSREIGGEIKSGAFVEDARGRWFITFSCDLPDDLPCGNGAVGIDLGLKALATLSTGEVIPALQHYRKHEAALGRAQRARNKKRVRSISVKIANARRHHLHTQSTRIADQNSLIVVGNVSAAKLAQTRMAKSVLDAGWSAFRQMLRFKAARRQAVFVEADERFTTQVCSECGTLPASRPRGIADLGIRRWECSDCGASHDRDVNAARNILRVGLECQPPVGGILLASGRH